MDNRINRPPRIRPLRGPQTPSSGLPQEKSGRIGGRASPALVEHATARTGIEADTDFIELDLANIALEDRFAETFKAVRGAVDSGLRLGF